MGYVLALPPSFSIFGINIAFYAVCIMTGMMVAASMAIVEGQRLGIQKEDFYDGILYGIPLSILGTRLYYVIFNFDEFGFDILKIVGLKDGGLAGLAIHGGIISGFAWAYYFTKKRGMNLWKVFDCMVPAFLAAQIIGRWGNFFNQEAHGPAVKNVALFERIFPKFITEQMYINGVFYHPTFLYEGVWNLLGLVIILVLRRSKLVKVGDLIFGYLVWYGTGRFFIEFLRTDSLLIFGIKVNVLMSFAFVGLGIAGFILKRKYISAPNYIDELTLLPSKEEEKKMQEADAIIEEQEESKETKE